MKILVFARGPGESSHAYAIAKYFNQNNIKVIVALQQALNLSFFQQLKTKIKIIITPTLIDLSKLINNNKPDKVILCNSKSFTRNEKKFIFHSPWPKIETYTLDSNWLFEKSPSPYQYIKWAKKYFIALPKTVFDLGLRKNGGHFNIPKTTLDKIIPVGLIPSYKKETNSKDFSIYRKLKLNLKKNEKLIFCYFSGVGAGGRFWVLENLLKTTKNLINSGIKIRVLAVGYIKDISYLPSFPWFTYLNPQKINFETFYEVLSSSDLVFQHQGLATLSQAISAQVPTICNVFLKSSSLYFGLHRYEVKPFARLNLCQLLYKTTPIKIIQKNILNLLLETPQRKKMIASQKKIYSSGEKNLLNLLLKIPND